MVAYLTCLSHLLDQLNPVGQSRLLHLSDMIDQYVVHVVM